jgi:hypothetical protein
MNTICEVLVRLLRLTLVLGIIAAGAVIFHQLHADAAALRKSGARSIDELNDVALLPPAIDPDEYRLLPARADASGFADLSGRFVAAMNAHMQAADPATRQLHHARGGYRATLLESSMSQGIGRCEIRVTSWDEQCELDGQVSFRRISDRYIANFQIADRQWRPIGVSRIHEPSGATCDIPTSWAADMMTFMGSGKSADELF